MGWKIKTRVRFKRTNRKPSHDDGDENLDGTDATPSISIGGELHAQIIGTSWTLPGRAGTEPVQKRVETLVQRRAHPPGPYDLACLQRDMLRRRSRRREDDMFTVQPL